MKSCEYCGDIPWCCHAQRVSVFELGCIVGAAIVAWGCELQRWAMPPRVSAQEWRALAETLLVGHMARADAYAAGQEHERRRCIAMCREQGWDAAAYAIEHK